MSWYATIFYHLFTTSVTSGYMVTFNMCGGNGTIMSSANTAVNILQPLVVLYKELNLDVIQKTINYSSTVSGGITYYGWFVLWLIGGI